MYLTETQLVHLELSLNYQNHTKNSGYTCSNTVARREKVLVREKGGERRIKYGIVGIEYVIEITRVRKK